MPANRSYAIHSSNRSSASLSNVFFIIIAIFFSIFPIFETPRIIVSIVPMLLSMFLKRAPLSRTVYVASLFLYLPVFLVLSWLGLYGAEIIVGRLVSWVLFLICMMYILVGILILLKPYSFRDIIALILATIASFISIVALQNLHPIFYLLLGFGLPISYLSSYLVIADRLRELEKDKVLILN